MARKKWLRARHKTVFAILRGIFGVHTKIRYNYKAVKSELKPPFLLMSNHATTFDPVFSSLSFKCPIYYCATDDIFNIPVVSGFVFDMMILAGISAIQFEVIEKLWLPLLMLCVFGTVVTFVYLNFVCKRLYPTYRYQAMVSLFGMLTGTASTGMILLREIDPKFQTPAANNLIMQSVPAMAFGFPMLLLAGYAAAGMTASLITLAACVGLFALMNVIVFIKFKRKKSKDDGKDLPETNQDNQ